MIERKGSKIIYICDMCGDRLETSTSELHVAKEEAKCQGWKPSVNDGTGGWVSLCDNCEIE